MKHLFTFFVFICFCTIGANSQTINKTTPTKTNTPTQSVKTDEELAIEKSQEWFKEKYVENMFKDPYSYRVVGIKAIPITKRESLDKLITKVKKNMDDCNLGPEDRTEKTLAVIKSRIEENETMMNQLKNETDEYSKKRYDIYAKYLKEYIKLGARVETYLLSEKEYNSLVNSKASMSEEELNSFAYFDIHLDCYSKNDLGNEVLGRFVFPFTKDGVVVDDKTTLSMVEKIN